MRTDFFKKSLEELDILAVMAEPNFTFEGFCKKHGVAKTVKAMELQLEKDKIETLRRKYEG